MNYEKNPANDNTFEEEPENADPWQNMLQELEAEQEEDIKSEFSYLEALLNYSIDSPRTAAWAMSGIVGVYTDIKPVAFEHTNDEEIFDEDTERIRKSLESLGITLEVVNDGKDQNDTYARTWYFSKDPKLISELREAFQSRYGAEGGAADAVERKIGKLLGYPETATEYFIQRDHSDDPYSDEPNSEHYIHSPEHATAEAEQYEKPLYAAMEKYCPDSLAILLDN